MKDDTDLLRRLQDAPAVREFKMLHGKKAYKPWSDIRFWLVVAGVAFFGACWCILVMGGTI